MILDALARFSTAQSSTVSVASTDIIDTVAAGDAYNNAWFLVHITTAAAITNGAPTATFQLQTSSDAFLGVGNDTTLVASAAFVAADLTAGKMLAIRIPPTCKRYLRGYLVVPVSVTANFSALAFDMAVVADVGHIIGTPRYQMGITI